MDQIGKVQGAHPEDPVTEYKFRKDQGPSRDENQGHQKIQYREVRNFLKGIKFPSAIDRKRSLFTFKDAIQVIPCLLW